MFKGFSKACMNFNKLGCYLHKRVQKYSKQTFIKQQTELMLQFCHVTDHTLGATFN